MTIRVKSKVNVKIWEDTSEKDYYFGPDDTLAEQTYDSYTKTFAGKFTINPSTSETLSKGDITTVKGFYLELQGPSDGTAMAAATVNVNATGAVPLEQPGSGLNAKAYLEGGTYSSVEVANTDPALTLTGRYAMWGE